MSYSIDSLSQFDYVRYSGTSFIKDIPNCPKCGKTSHVGYMSRKNQELITPPIYMQSRWNCFRCEVWFMIPYQSHIVLRPISVLNHQGRGFMRI